MAQLPPPVHGAALRNKSLLDSQLIRSRFTIHPLPLKFIDNMRDLGKFSLRKIWLMIAYCFRLTGILLTRRIDLAYFTMSPYGGAFYRDILFMTILKLFGKKRLLHFRVKGIQKTGRGFLGRKLVKYALKGSDIVCLSQHHMLDMQGFTDRPPYIVPNGIKVESEFLPLAEAYRYTPGTPPKILFLSNLSRKKGVPELIEALQQLHQQGYAFTASLVGSEWDMSYDDVKQLVSAAQLSDRVTIEGPKYGKEKFSFIAESDIFVFPTYFELFPGVILEAMQFGKAIVSTFEGSIPEMIDNHINGILVEQQNATQLAGGIATLLNDPAKREEMGKAAKQKFFEAFTLQAFEENMCRVYTDVIEKKGPE